MTELSVKDDTQLVLPATEIDQRPWKPVRDGAGGKMQILRKSTDNMVGIIHLDPGVSLASNVYENHERHAYVVQGSATILDQALTAGSYAYIPRNTHCGDISAGPDGGSILFFYAGPMNEMTVRS